MTIATCDMHKQVTTCDVHMHMARSDVHMHMATYISAPVSSTWMSKGPQSFKTLGQS